MTSRTRTISAATSAAVAARRRGQHGHPERGFGGVGQGDRPAEDVGAQPAPVGALRRAAGQDEVAVEGCAQQVEIVEAEPLDERDALQHGGEVVAVVGRCAEQEPPGLRCDEREPLSGRHQRVGQRARPARTGAACRFSSSRSAPGKSREIAPAPVLEAPPGSQSPLGALVGVHRAQRVADQLVGDALEHQGGARAPSSSCPTLSAPAPSWAAQPSVVPRTTTGVPAGMPVASRRRGARPSRSGCPDRTRAGSRCGGHAERVEHVGRPGLLDQVRAGLEGVAEVGGDVVPDQPAVDEVVLVGQPRAARSGRVLPQQPQQLRQRPRRLHRW